jgi:hypothetical protein
MPNPPDVGTISIVSIFPQSRHLPFRLILDLSALFLNICFKISISINALELLLLSDGIKHSNPIV